MRNIITIALLVLVVDLIFNSCANPGNPTGGPKDTIPPTLLNSYPLTGTTNFKDAEFELTFSEYINADKLRQKLIITPKSNINFKTLAKRNKLIIKLEGDLQDSTTYNFNFSDGLTDITEKNSAINLNLAFSTGPIIDSLSIKGTVTELLTEKECESFLVGIYPESDTLDFLTQTPMYFATTDEAGSYSLNYIKSGNYKLISFDDFNNNLLLDPETEAHGFLEDIITLDTSITAAPIRTILQNVKPLTVINARPAGPYVEIKLNKTPSQYTITPTFINHILSGDKKDIIKLYKPDQVVYGDSITCFLQAEDSLGNQVKDTLQITFLESNRKLPELRLSTQPTKLELSDSIAFNITSNKPIITLNTDSISIKADSTYSKNITPFIEINPSKTNLLLTFLIDKDSVLKEHLAASPPDTSIQTRTSTEADQPALSLSRPKSNLKLHINSGSFISVEGDTSKQITLTLNEPKEEPSGTLKISIDTDWNMYTIQLLDEQGSVKYSANQEALDFNRVDPANYNIRVLIDQNEDGKYSYGNLLQNNEPEPIYIHPEKISVRENWIVELGITF